MINVREAEVTDSYDIAKINIADWEKSLKGLVPDIFLANISLDKRTGVWAEILECSCNDDDRIVYVALESGEPVGYIYGYVTDDADGFLKIEDFCAADTNDKSGIRKSLFDNILAFASSKNIDNMYALCTAQSDSAEFYRLFSGRVSEVQEIDIHGEKVPHTLFVWKDIRKILPAKKSVIRQIFEITGIAGPLFYLAVCMLLYHAFSTSGEADMYFLYALYPLLAGVILSDRVIMRIEKDLISSVLTLRLRRSGFVLLITGVFILPVLFFYSAYSAIIPLVLFLFSLSLHINLSVLKRYVILLSAIRKRGWDVQKNS